MATERQIAANRENAKKSTGPKTPAGLAAVRLNGLKHGLCAKTVVVMGEDPAEFEALVESLHREHRPATPTELILVRQLAMAAWRQLRLYRMEAGFFFNEDECHNHKSDYQSIDDNSRLAYLANADAINDNVLLNFHRFEVRLERSIRSAIQELRRSRAERLAKNANQTQSQPKAAPTPQILDMEIVETLPEPVTSEQEQPQRSPLAA